MADAYKFASLGYAAAATATPATWGFTSASGCSETAGYICCKDIDNCCICDCIVGWRCKSCETDCNECMMGITPATSSPMCQRVHSSASSSLATPATAT